MYHAHEPTNNAARPHTNGMPVYPRDTCIPAVFLHTRSSAGILGTAGCRQHTRIPARWCKHGCQLSFQAPESAGMLACHPYHGSRKSCWITSQAMSPTLRVLATPSGLPMPILVPNTSPKPIFSCERSLRSRVALYARERSQVPVSGVMSTQMPRLYDH